VKADVKSGKFRRIRYLVSLPLIVPSRFLLSCITVIWAFRLKPYPTAFKEFGIRVVAPKDDGTWDDHIKVYAALELLNRHDEKMMELVKKHIRIIFLVSIETSRAYHWKTSGAYYWGKGVCLLNLRRIPVEMSPEQRAVAIIGWLVYEASLVEFAGEFGAYLHRSKEAKTICEEEKRRTLQKFCE
jgi:hypothetical protein